MARRFAPYRIKEVKMRRRTLRDGPNKGKKVTPLGWATWPDGRHRGLIEIDPRQRSKGLLEHPHP